MVRIEGFATINAATHVTAELIVHEGIGCAHRVDHTPTVNALLNSAATLLLTLGFVCIKTKHEKAHRACMLSAFAVSMIFLFFYVLHKYLVRGVHTPFAGEGVWRYFY